MFLQGSCFVLNKSALVKGVRDGLRIKWDVRKARAVFDSPDYTRPLSQGPVGIGPVVTFPLGLVLEGGHHFDLTTIMLTAS